MITLAPQVRVFLCSETVDMKKIFDGLVGIIESAMGQDPVSGSLFVFFNRRRDRVKILYWGQVGYCIWYQQLQKGTYQLPPQENAAAADQSPPQQEEKKKRTSRGRRRRKFPECMPREQRLIYLKPEEIPVEMRDNPRARRFFKQIGELLEVIPMQFKVIEQYLEVIVLDREDEQSAIATAPRPVCLIKSFASPSLLAYLTVSRFADHLPYYRLEDITGRAGYRIERSTQWRWMREVSQGVTRLVDLMWHRIRQSTVRDAGGRLLG